MSLLLFLKLQVQQKVRSVSLGRDLLAAVVLGIVLFFVLAYVILLAVSLPYILNETLQLEDPVGFVNKYLIFLFAGEFFYRFFLQKLPVTELQHYLHLPVPRWKIIHFLLQKSFISLLNVVAILLLMPFAIMEVSNIYGNVSAFYWMGTIVCTSWTIHWITLLFKGEMGDRPLGIVILFLVYLMVFGAQYYGWYDVGAIIKPFFDLSLNSGLPLFISGVLFLGFYIISFRYYRNRAYEEELTSTTGWLRFDPNLGFLSSFGRAGAMADAEFKLICRHKKSRTYLYISLLFLFYGLLFYPNIDFAHNTFDRHFSLFLGLFITGSFLFNYGQFYLSWNSANFDYYLIQNNGLESMIKGKALLFIAVSTLFFLLSIPYAYYGWQILIVHLAAFIFNIGFSMHLLTIFSFWRPKPMDINKGGMFNYEGLGAAQFLMIIPMMIIPYIIYLPFAALFGYQYGLLALILIGITGLFFFEKITKFLVATLQGSRHQISASFRQEI